MIHWRKLHSGFISKWVRFALQISANHCPKHTISGTYVRALYMFLIVFGLAACKPFSFMCQKIQVKATKWMFPKIMVTPKSCILIGCSIINHPFWGTPIFGNTQIETRHGAVGNLTIVAKATWGQTRFRQVAMARFFSWCKNGRQIDAQIYANY